MRDDLNEELASFASLSRDLSDKLKSLPKFKLIE